MAKHYTATMTNGKTRKQVSINATNSSIARKRLESQHKGYKVIDSTFRGSTIPRKK
jgi:hypothetical protein